MFFLRFTTMPNQPIDYNVNPWRDDAEEIARFERRFERAQTLDEFTDVYTDLVNVDDDVFSPLVFMHLEDQAATAFQRIESLGA